MLVPVGPLKVMSMAWSMSVMVVARLSLAPPATVAVPLVMAALVNWISMASGLSARASSKAVKVKLKLLAMKLLSKLKVLPARLTPVARPMAVSMSPSKVLVKSASVAVPILAMSTLTMLVPVGPRPG